MFHDLRFVDGKKDPACVLNDPRYEGARILVAGPNFGCGSSREQAVWALTDEASGQFYRSIIAPSFGDIFFNNAYKNGLLLVRLSEEVVRTLQEQLRARPGVEIEVDLEANVVIGPDGTEYRFDMEPFARECIRKGLDIFSMTLLHATEIDDFEERARNERPWLFVR